jgi:RNA 2',3'-cyclic 3'-phosphodiesterase
LKKLANKLLSVFSKNDTQHMRIFVGIDLEEAIRTKIARFLEGVSGFSPEARWVSPESLHITLKFIGEQKPEQVAAIGHYLRRIKSGPIEIAVSNYGFFPTARAPRVFWIGIRAEPALSALAAQIDEVANELGVPKEERAFSPHLTLARGGAHGRIRSGDPKWRKSDKPNSVFATLQERLANMSESKSDALDFGTMTAKEFILYESHLSPAGSNYAKLERFSMVRKE